LCKHEMESFFGNNVSMWSEYRQIPDRRIRDVYVETYVGAGNTCAYFNINTMMRTSLASTIILLRIRMQLILLVQLHECELNN
jgi:hypothetical protein